MAFPLAPLLQESGKFLTAVALVAVYVPVHDHPSKLVTVTSFTLSGPIIASAESGTPDLVTPCPPIGTEQADTAIKLKADIINNRTPFLLSNQH
jgi:hypothetical protein